MSFGWTVRIIALIFFVLLAVGNLTCTSRLAHQPRKARVSDFLRPFRETEYALLTLGAFFTFWVLFIPNTYLPQYARSQGASDTLATSTLTILNATR